ncbi:D-isomer specific 2-hydroxyacid dehydrogenase, NAD-binding domain conserved site 1 [Phytophthora cactorum]|nr:D-isomer specific 2-hydroxyacid dehydrogenase, NAD-binding domain conserved site 1 [Phytophthora cactorum]
MDSGWGPSIYPCVVGHEIIGEITLAGDEVKGMKVGDRVGVGAQVFACLNKDPAAPCKLCTNGDDAYCPHRVWTYSDRYQDKTVTYGGYADYIRVMHEYAFKIPENLPSDVAAPLLCAGATVFRPLKEAGVKPGKRVGIVGIGGLGHLAIQFAKAMGADAVVAFSRSPNKEKEVRDLGATDFVNYTDKKQAAAAEMSIDVLLSPTAESQRQRLDQPRLSSDSAIETPRTSSVTQDAAHGLSPASSCWVDAWVVRNGSRVAPRMSRQIGASGSTSMLQEGEAVSLSGTTASEEEAGETDELTFTLPELSKEGDDTGRTVRETWPTDHVMLLYMLSRYAVCARTKEDKESWIRQIPLLVLMYEGIAAGALNFDYAPAAMVIAQEGRPKRIWMNTTQDGKSAIDDLREANLINGLKLSTKDYHSVTAFQVSLLGLQLLSQASLSGEIQVEAEEEPEFNEEGRFILESIGYFRYSGVTETEDVSYVSSPFVPQCVRSLEAYQQLSSNAHRALEAASGQSNIRDTLSEAIVLANPVCLVDTQFEVPPGLTEVRILDYDPVRYINFEAEINFPEDDGIVQVENFGIHLNVDGTIFYGIKVDAILDKRADRISVDLLSRLLVDIHQDSSEIMDDLLSSYQTSLLDMVFLGDIANRGKFNMIMADQIDPFMPGLEYMDRGDFENELKQVLGDIHCAYDIGEDSVLIVGRDGMLIAGSASKRFEKVFISYFSLLCREMFLRSFFTRIFVLDELLKHIRDLIFRAKEDPHHLVTIRGKLNQATNDLILFTDTLGYLLESLEFVKIPQKSPNASEEEEWQKYLNTSELEDIFKTVEGNTKALADSSLTVEHCGSSLELVQVLLAGSFAFTLLDRVPGGSLNVDMPEYKKRKSHEVEYGRRTLRLKVNKAIDIEKFEIFLGTRVLDKQESVSQLASEVRRVVWKDLGLQACNDERAHPRRSIAYAKGSLTWKHKLTDAFMARLGKWQARKSREAANVAAVAVTFTS